MTERSIGEIRCNGRSYRKPAVPTVVVCYDGCDPRYISHGVLAGLFPNISRIMSEGFFAIADAAMPRPTPDMYSPDLSVFVLDAGIRLLETHRADVLYLSLSDMVQHSAGPGEDLADSFNHEVDKRVGRILELGALVAIVADHGMTDPTASHRWSIWKRC